MKNRTKFPDGDTECYKDDIYLFNFKIRQNDSEVHLEKTAENM